MGVKHKILFVDEDAELLAAFRRSLRRKYAVSTAPGPIRALEAVADGGPFAAVVADMHMQGLDGNEFFSRLRAACPDTMRIMLTGQADLATAMEAVNKGHVFRFLVKPCPEETLATALDEAVVQHIQATAETAFLKGALRGIIKVLTDLLALLNAEALGRASRVRRLVCDMARYLEAPDPWRIELAVMLSQVGAMVMPESMFARLRANGGLDGDEALLFDRHPAISGELLESIPRLGEVAGIVRLQEAHFLGSPGLPSGEDIPLGARLLKAALDYDRLLTSGRPRDEALSVMAGRHGWYDPRILELLGLLAGSREGYRRGEVTVASLVPGMVLEEDVRSSTGETAAMAGQVVDRALLERLPRLDISPQASLRVLAPEAVETPSGLSDPELLALLRKVRNASPDSHG